jgi:hypothetical protein
VRAHAVRHGLGGAQSGSGAGKRRGGGPVSGARCPGGALERVEAEQTCAVGASWRAGLGRCVHGGPRSRTSQTALARPEWRKRECGARRCGREGGVRDGVHWS